MVFTRQFTAEQGVNISNFIVHFAVNSNETNSIVTFAENYIDLPFFLP